MRKLLLGLITLIGLLSITISFAGPINKESGYFSTYHPMANKKMVGTPLFPLTDITVVNASPNIVYVSVPNTAINDVLYPNSQPDHIRNYNGAFDTMIILQDVYRTTFWSNIVCPRALITVYNGTVNTDTEYCY